MNTAHAAALFPLVVPAVMWATEPMYTVRKALVFTDTTQGTMQSYAGTIYGVTADVVVGSGQMGAWRLDENGAVQTALGGPLYVPAGGARLSSTDRMASNGDSAGSQNDLTGRAIRWFHTGGQGYQVGLINAEHTRTDGFRSSGPGVMMPGVATGTSNRYYGSLQAGYSAWMATAAGTQRLGFYDTAHTNTASVLGEMMSGIYALGEDGTVYGQSMLYSLGQEMGWTMWSWSGGQYTLIPNPPGADLVNNQGATFATLLAVNPTGQIVGTATRYAPATTSARGNAIWVRSGGTTVITGLTDAVHTRSDGMRSSTYQAMNAAGDVLGYSERYLATGTASSVGLSVWLYRGGVTTALGLTGPGFTPTDPRRERNSASLLNSHGDVAGRATRTGLGNAQAAWLYRNGTYIQLGLTDAAHTGPGGLRSSNVAWLNEAGDVVGYSYRYRGDNSPMLTWWVYTAATGQYALIPNVVSSLGEWNTNPQFVSEDHLIVGVSTIYQNEAVAGMHAFAWTPTRGRVDLDTHVVGGLAAQGLATLAGLNGGGNWPLFAGAGGDYFVLQAKSLQGDYIPVVLERVACPADMGVQGGLPGADQTLNSNDFIVFMDYFFALNPRADIGQQGGLSGSDGAWDNNDFVAFIDYFFAGCG